MMYIRLKSFRLVLLCFILWKKRSLEKKRRPGPLSPPGTFLATCLPFAGHAADGWSSWPLFLHENRPPPPCPTLPFICNLGLFTGWSTILIILDSLTKTILIILDQTWSIHIHWRKNVARFSRFFTKGSLWFKSIDVGKDLQNPTSRDGNWTPTKRQWKILQASPSSRTAFFG